MSSLEVNKLSIINEGQDNKKLTFTPNMNVKGISEFMCWDEEESLNRIINIQLLTNLELVYFNQTSEYRLRNFPFANFKNLQEVIIETSNILRTLQDLQTLIKSNNIDKLTL